MLNWPDDIEATDENHTEVLSFGDYLSKFEEAPYKHSRPTYAYLIDMIKYYGQTDDGYYKVFQITHPEAPAVYGQKATQESILQNLKNFEEEGFNNKFILLVGPNGSSKSSLVRKLMKGAEDYSTTDDGPLYSFSWIFPIDQYVKGSLGLSANPTNTDITTYAYLEDKDVSAILPSELRDHPILLVPREHRRKIFEESLKDYPELLDSVRKSYLYKGDLSKRNRMIYDALLKNYKGKHREVLKHIRVERFTLSRRYSVGAVTIEPQIHVDARMQQITMDKRLASLPPSLQSLNLFSIQGEVVMANRGMLEFSDLLKRPLDTYKYLLQTMETSNINLHGILTELDIFFIGTSNEIHLAAFKQHPDYNSFKGRFSFVRVPYLLNYKEEMNIYEEQVEGLKDKSILEPHALEALCQFSVMTRLRLPQVKDFEDKRLANIVTNLNPLEKTQILAGDDFPERIDLESMQVLRSGLEELKNEFVYDNLYEGKFGISPREVKNIIYRLTSLHKTITVIEVLDYLEDLIAKKNDYDFLNMTPQSDYHNPTRFLALIKDQALDQFDSELRDSLGMIDDRSYEDYIKRYIENVNALIKGEKIKNNITGKYEEVDTYFITEFEKGINLKEGPENFRSTLISKLGAYYLDNRGKTITYKEVFPDLVNRLKESFRNEQKKTIQMISRNIVYFEAEKQGEENGGSGKTPLSRENREEIQGILDNLHKNYGYSQNGALSLIKVLLKTRY